MIEPKEQFADVSVQRLAKVYAEALLNAAEHVQQVPQVLEELDSLIDDVLKVDPRLEALFSSAVMGRKARAEALEKAFAGQASPIFLNLLLVLNHQERLELIRAIRKAVHDLYDERTRRLHVLVYSAVPLSEEVQGRLAGVVRDQFKREPILNLYVDPALLGGLKIRIGDKQYDSSVRTRVANLGNQLITSSSYEIQSQRNRFCSDSGN
jgi:F-type H+-transporting ATPase subunit delta